MENCLVTKLKSVVDNSNLEKLGIFSIGIKSMDTPAADGRFIDIGFTEKVTINCIGGSLYKTYGGSSIGTSYTSQDSDWNASLGIYRFVGYISNNECTLEVPKYTLKRFGGSSYCIKNINIAKFNYTEVNSFSGNFLEGNVTSLPQDTTYVNFNGNTKIIGSLSDFASLVNITNLNTGNSSISPSSLSSIGTLTSLTDMQIIAFGSIEDFVSVQRANGRTTCDGITCRYLGALSTNRSTFNGTAIANKASTTLSWTADTITYDGTTINA